MSRRATPRRVALVVLGALALLACVSALALRLGVERIALGRALSEPDSVDALLLGDRLARVALGALVGAALAPSGVALQALLRNPLADPYVLGISGGASVLATLAIVVGAVGPSTVLGAWTLPAWAFLGAAGAAALVFAVGRLRGRLVPNLALLAGVVLNALAAALVLALRTFASPTKMHQALHWLTGALSTPVGPGALLALAAYVAVGLGLLVAAAPALNALALGADAARTVGVDAAAVERRAFLGASLLTGAAVALAGPIGFVGVVVPHALRRVLGPDHRTLLPASALVGAAFLVGADALARLAFLVAGTEPTVGVLTALLGAPAFLILLRRRGGERLF